MLVAFSTLAILGCLSYSEAAFGASTVTSGTVAGVVCDTAGTPQVGIAVELLRGDSSLAARVFTDGKGNYSIASILPGQYALKAMGGSFIPTLKQNLRIRANTIVNLTMESLYDLMQFAPQMRRARPRGDEDWAWTLRTAESRPLLRWQEDGSPILVWDGSAETRRGAASKRRVRVITTAGDKRFGSGSQQISMAMQEDTSARRRIALSAEAAPDAAGLMDAMLGFRQEMANSGMGSSSVQTLAAVMVDPEAGSGSQQGLEAVALRSWESLQLLDSLEAEAGSDQVMARVGDGFQSGSAVFAALPFASVTLHHGQGALEYRVATARTADPEGGESLPGQWLPVLSERNGALVLEHGLHQELGWSTSAGPAEVQLVFYGDTLENPMIEGFGHLNASADAGQWMLVDGASGLLRTAGPNYSTTGMLASVESRLPGHNRVKLSYASGDALVMQATTKPEDVATIVQGAHSRRAQMYSIALSGTAEGTGTRWRASYRWQPESTVTQVAPFAVDASEPYLNVYIRQPIWVNRQGPGGVEAQVDLRNLLAEGYQPFLTSDGSRLYFAQAQRCVRGGLAFTF
ncbi:carboxypeptidase-like regulatory domain-containing protein [Acidicapsa acidisoli]|uniref:carboxypeptidase-like regulatory domain-containing protein n=1 Tax=Acidicapsa acidisoli TaxID=1615681 RepID=UPI0021E037BC|nr:carboxypeptidase-like regulatory domain-containing protein [Acidicapsa acidisoli]